MVQTPFVRLRKAVVPQIGMSQLDRHPWGSLQAAGAAEALEWHLKSHVDAVEAQGQPVQQIYRHLQLGAAR